MKKLITKMSLFVMVILAIQMNGQTVTNVNELHKMADEFAAQWAAAQVRVQQYAKDHNVPIRQEFQDGKVMEMVDVKEGIPFYYFTHALGAAYTTKATEMWEGGSTGLDINGSGYDKVGVWDAGAILTTHQEFTDQGDSRVTKMDGNYPSHPHATFVGGIIAAAGIVENAIGMASGCLLGSWEWTNDQSEMANAAAAGLELSNSSYGIITGWELNGSTWHWYGNSNIDPNEDYYFGFYDSHARAMDQIAYNAPNYLIVRSAGNDRGQGPGQGSPENDGGSDGYDCISHDEIAKNILSVGAVREVLNYQKPEDVKMTTFSSWGPCDDGRIKPDIVGKGYQVYSTLNGSNSDYGTEDGTSFSSPNVTGSMVLLCQHYENLNGGTPMRAATLKGIVLHTAEEAGPDPGPDYKFGWGLMNTKRAAFLITDDQGQNSIDERILQDGDYYSREINVPEGMPELRVTISWTDPPGTPVSPQLNPRDPMLVDDLDLKVLDPDNNVHYPYSLDPDNPSAAATTSGENDVDNIEMVVINNPDPGTYTIFVDHDGTLYGGEQAYSLIISGIDEYTVVPDCSIAMATPDDGAQDILVNQWLEWEKANFASSYDIYFGTDGGGVETPTNVFNGENIPVNGFSTYMQPATTYYLQVVPRNSQGTAEGCDQIWSFTPMAGFNDYPHIESMGDVTIPDLPYGWQAVDNSEAEWTSTDQYGHNDGRSMGCFNPGGIVKTDYDNWFISPPFTVENGKEYHVTYFYKSLIAGNPESMTLFWGMGPFPDDLTSVVYEDNEITESGWQEGHGLIVPGTDGYIFLGFHVNSQQGYGVFLDDIMIDNWGTVGINSVSNDHDALIYNYSGNVVVQADDWWNGADLKIMNLMGQTIYQGKFQGNLKVNVHNLSAPGLFIVTLSNGSDIVTKKVVIQ